MKVILYLAMTVNGLIARNDDDTSFVSKTEWETYPALVKEIGNMVVGRRTYEIMRQEDQFDDFAGITIVVVTTDKQFKPAAQSHYPAKSPREAVALLEKQGFKEITVAGGSKINASFMKENLVDEVYLDLEPVLLGKGIGLFAPSGFEVKLELLGSKKISANEIQLHYKVIR
ncbi:hypothetical protein A2160_01020 [Candidatus Beckwithbacteria bacterium RBG_13_42_9]|uniref:Bacterial bifunctional deaminase-reductase C-terminal domain-containing protein n=1 Tax=Candidatus Beckwithbacteria bacterium RBG_13_42_9 TaxID=1797457 RepID=A0A1F5E7Y6_9BACT|nr:MAG: hypothetical protein A2160_01020 [Candidatus Beckwithbacteria bacterium RBG_13_42_9]